MRGDFLDPRSVVIDRERIEAIRTIVDGMRASPTKDLLLRELLKIEKAIAGQKPEGGVS